MGAPINWADMHGRLLFASLALAGASGCSANVGASAELDAEASAAAASIVVERVTGPDGTRSDAKARFVRGRAGPLTEDVLRFLALDEAPAPLGSCVRASGEVPSVPVGGLRLLDVGKVTLHADSTAAPFELSKRRVPDVVDVVSGVIYGASRLDVASRAPLEVRVAGEPELGPVRVAIEAPGDVGGLRMDGHDPAHPVAAGSDVELTWEPSAEREPISVDVTAIDGEGRRSTWRCGQLDTGHATVAAALLGDGDGIIAVRRSHRTTFRSAGIDKGELRVDFVRELPYTRRR